MQKRANIDTIGLDFDATVVRGGFPDIEKAVEVPNAIETIKKLIEVGYTLVLWTCREDQKHIEKRWLQDAVDYLKENDIDIKYINETPEEFEFREEGINRKIVTDIYIDDRSFPYCGVNWDFIGWLLLEATDREFNSARRKLNEAPEDFLEWFSKENT